MINWYDLPAYYDVSFSYEMSDELAFLKNVFKKYSNSSQPKLLEPACGTGRLIIPLIREGFDCSGFDLNKNALLYLDEKLNRNQLHANVFYDGMINFTTHRKYDGIYCTVDTFRHLLTEKEARQHLLCVSKALKKNGIYVLGLHLLSKEKKIDRLTRWTSIRGRLTIKTIMSMIKLDKNKRRETLEVELKIKAKERNNSYTSVYQLRTYTLFQLMKILKSLPELEIISVYDEYYDLSNPIMLDSGSDYAVLLLRKK
ncbi:MAG: class I SAM-dependent methyltransferase [SAR202 cluster bacterium]|nr:class I SAM-dependent methyltransferase [SAR202 cluster bacterium]